jgi:hypothetical protein
MAIVLIEGWDHLTASEVTSKGWSANPNSMAAGRFDGQSASYTGASTTLNKTLPSSYSTLFAGFAFNPASLPASTQDFFCLQAGATLTFRLGLNTSGELVVRNSGGTIIATGTTVLVAGSWYYIEVKCVINGASGSAEVHLNGVTEISSTAGNFGSANLDTVSFRTMSFTTARVQIDDVYVADSSGSAPRNTFLGDVRVETIYPNGAGAHSDWIPNSGSSHYTQVDEAQADGDTSYVSDSTPGHIDTYAFGDIDTGATVYGVQTNLYARKDDANTRQIAPVVRQSGTDSVGATVTLGSSYATFSQLYNQDPTAADWTPTTVNADEFGVKEIA